MGATLVAALIASFAIAACGSSSNNNSTGTGSSNTSTGSGSSVSAGVKAAEAVANQYMKVPTHISVTKPIGKPIPKGKTIDFIDCGIPTCTAVGNSLEQAAKVLGWTYKSIPASTEPSGAQKGFETAISQHPDGVAYTGIDASEMQTQLTQLQKMHIPVATCCTTDPVGNGITNIMRRGASSSESGKIAAAFIVAHSKGKANTLYVNLPVFSIYKPYETSFKQHYKQWCPSCGFSSLNMSATSIGTNAPQIIANYLSAHRSINYVFVVNDALGLGLPAAMKAAGVTGVNYVGSDSTAANFPYVKNGEELATIPASTAEFGWYEADILARAFAGVPQVNEATSEEQIWTAKNMPANTKGVVALNPNFQAQFKKLWGVS